MEDIVVPSSRTGGFMALAVRIRPRGPTYLLCAIPDAKPFSTFGRNCAIEFHFLEFVDAQDLQRHLTRPRLAIPLHALYL